MLDTLWLTCKLRRKHKVYATGGLNYGRSLVFLSPSIHVRSYRQVICRQLVDPKSVSSLRSVSVVPTKQIINAHSTHVLSQKIALTICILVQPHITTLESQGLETTSVGVTPTNGRTGCDTDFGFTIVGAIDVHIHNILLCVRVVDHLAEANIRRS